MFEFQFDKFDPITPDSYIQCGCGRKFMEISESDMRYYPLHRCTDDILTFQIMQDFEDEFSGHMAGLSAMYGFAPGGRLVRKLADNDHPSNLFTHLYHERLAP